MSGLGRWFGKRSAASPALLETTIDDLTWQRVVGALPFLAEHDGLRAMTAQFLARKGVHPALSWPEDLAPPGDFVRVAIAAQACLPVLAFGLDFYDDFAEVVIYPGEFDVVRHETDEDGVVHDLSGPLAGEALQGGPVLIGWNVDDVPGMNVVVHEFAHKLDMAAGNVDGMPRFHPRLHDRALRQAWRRELEAAFDRFVYLVDRLEQDFPRNLDPESDEGMALYGTLPLDLYASTDEAEFFAVSSEAWFVDRARLDAEFPEWSALLARYYRPTGA
ncbi:zinc-dependent peptidase [soil metagenome]